MSATAVPPGEPPPLLAFALAQVTLDEEIPMRAQVSPLLFQPLLLLGCLRRCLRRRAPLGHFGLLGRQRLACTGHSTQHGFDDLLDDMKLADLMWHCVKDLRKRLRIER